ncbi:4-alpha-glucanotransferase [Desulfuromonas soudanensis]|uniref:4-alpha-glucanotransferase n=2 Tax=Desulfuromonas soudanensis TaxID=1603606 RepID=A0A0M4D044_9BACT|nr:4-alpha-glucanotransferase [Desulfuromonas soudanensis]
MKQKRVSGILLHPTSLPGPYGLGSLGSEAYRFIDFLSGAGQSIWQILPLGPTGYGDSPYSAFSAFAGNPLLICPERLVERGDLDPADLAGVRMPEGEAHFGFVQGFLGRLLHKGAACFERQGAGARRAAYERFCSEQAYWLNDYAIFQALRSHFEHRSWNEWPEEIRCRRDSALHFWGEELAATIRVHKYAQFVFFEQWFALRDYAASRGVRILGDLPIFVALDSADVWANQHLFHLNEEGRPLLVAGVPPDYFSTTGQRWGNPLYRWEAMAEEGYAWWLSRFRWNLAQTDLVRIDHFRGFEACWAIPAEEKTAVNGQWLKVPGAELFRALKAALGRVPIIAEDLGLITPEVEALRREFGFPGMKILQFAFGSGADNPYLPHNLESDCVVYTGTHDNDTTLGWWRKLSGQEREGVRAYLGSSGRDQPWELIRAALASVGAYCIIPLQDLLALGSEARMNTPGRAGGNWGWRFSPGDLGVDLQQRLSALTALYGRHLRPPENGP